MPHPLEASNVSCARGEGAQASRVVEASARFEPGTLNLLHGPKGSGRNLFLRLLGLIEAPDQGEIAVLGKSTRGWSEAERSEVRSRHFGFVFESPFLLPSFNVVENIAMPYFKLTGATPEAAREQTAKVLEFVGLGELAGQGVEVLGPEQQWRVSLARALVTEPMALFVEGIDSVLRDDALIVFLELLAAARQLFGCAVFATASSRELAAFFGRAIEFSQGRMVRDEVPGGFAP